MTNKTTTSPTATPESKTDDIKALLAKCADLKPASLVMEELSWKYMVRSAARAKNILLLGPTGCGKTLAAQTVASAVADKDKFYYFNLGATQDARSALIGNTGFNSKKGTFFSESTFVRAIQTENAVILLDEISRAHHDCVNILMTVLDDLQRYLRLDEKEDDKLIHVANGVTFIATANIGTEYTATRVMDRALLSRFPVKIEMPTLSADQEYDLLSDRFEFTDTEDCETLRAVCEIAAHTRSHILDDAAKISNFIPTRITVEIAELILDGFSLHEIAETTIYPNFSPDMGNASERTYMKQFVQKFLKDNSSDRLFAGKAKEATMF
jgi:MoxR-like ATPase